MTSISTKYDILKLQGFTNSNRNGFLTNRKMDRTLDFVAGVNADNGFFCTAYTVKRAVEIFVI